jgi:hypothetical protein
MLKCECGGILRNDGKSQLADGNVYQYLKCDCGKKRKSLGGKFIGESWTGRRYAQPQKPIAERINEAKILLESSLVLQGLIRPIEVRA